MSIIANGKNITAVFADGKEMQNVYVNGDLYWSKTPPAKGWHNAWSGLAYIFDMDAIIDTDTTYTYTYVFSGMSIADITGKTIQVDAEYDEYFENETTTLILCAERDDNVEKTNLPWSTGDYVPGYLSALQQSGSEISITADSSFRNFSDMVVFGQFYVTNVWYYQK